jgi:hypothetical protein
MFRFDRIGVGLHRPGSAKSSASARRFSSGPESRGHVEPPELPCAGRRVLKNSIRQELCFLSCSTRWFSSGPEPRGHVAPPELPYVRRRVLEPRGHVLTQSCPEPGGGNWSRRDTRSPRSCHEPGGGPGHVAPPELPRAGLLLGISGDFFLVASYCPTKNSMVLKKCRYSSAFSSPPLLLRSLYCHGFFFDFFRPCPSVVISGALQRHQIL